MLDGVEIGVVNSAVFSKPMGKSIALGHVVLSASAPATMLKVMGDVVCNATVNSVPFYDPQKKRTHS